MEVSRVVDDQLALGLRSLARSAPHRTAVSFFPRYLSPAEVSVYGQFAFRCSAVPSSGKGWLPQGWLWGSTMLRAGG